MSNSNGYLSRNLLDELDKKKEKKTAAPIVDNWQRLSASQQAAQKADAEAKQTAEPTKFSTGKLIEGIVRKGTTNAAHGMSSTFSWLEGALFAPAEALTGFDDLQEQHGLFYNWNSAIEKEREDAYRSSAANIKAGGTAAKIADTVGTGVVAALPQAITAFMSAGASLGAVGAQGLEATAVAAQQSPGILNSLRSAVTGLANNPNYWTSFLRTAGESYEQAKEDGASESKASLYAMSNGLFNAAIEVGGGLETLPKELRGGTAALRQWARSSAEEGAEEPIQGVIERGLQNVVYSKNNPLFSVKNETAVFNPATAAKEFGVGAAVGGILGGGQMAAADAANAIQQWRNPVVETVNPETAKPLRAGRATTIYNPYQGTVPVQTQSSGQIVEVPEDAIQRAQNYTQQAQMAVEASGGKGFKTFLTRLYQNVFQRHDGVAVENMTYEDNPYLVNVGNTVPAKVISDKNLSIQKLSLLDILPDVIKNGKYIGSGNYDQHGTKVKPVIRYDYFETPISINNIDYVARFDVEVFPGANNYRTHQLVNMDLTQTGARYPAPVAGPSPAESSPQRHYIPYLPNAVKPYSSTPQDYAALLRRLAESRTGLPTLTPEQEKRLETWNQLYPEMQMTTDEFLAR